MGAAPPFYAAVICTTVEALVSEDQQDSIATNAHMWRQQPQRHTHPTGRGRVGIKRVSRANIAVSESRPLALFMSDTCWAAASAPGQYKPGLGGSRRAGQYQPPTVTWYRMASPASVSNLDT
jgi:hypothetical protein